MEDINKNSAPGLPLCPNNSSNLTVMSLTTLRSHEVLKKPFSMMNHGGAGSSRTEPYPEPFDVKRCPPTVDDEDMKTENPSPPSDKNPSTGVGGICVKSEQAIDFERKWGRKMDPNMDPKKFRRVMSNRISAQKSRMKKLQYITDLEKNARDLQAEIAVLSPRVAYEQHHAKLLQMEKDILQQKLNNFTERSKIAFVTMEGIKAEVKRLREVQMIQQGKQNQEEARMFDWTPGLEQTANLSSLYQSLPQPVVVGIMNTNQDWLDPMLNFKTLTIDPPKSLM